MVEAVLVPFVVQPLVKQALAVTVALSAVEVVEELEQAGVWLRENLNFDLPVCHLSSVSKSVEGCPYSVVLQLDLLRIII